MKAKMKKSIYIMLSFALIASGLVFVGADVDATDTDQIGEVETVENEEETVEEETVEEEKEEDETAEEVEETVEEEKEEDETVENEEETVEETKEDRATGLEYVSNYTELLEAINNDKNVMLTSNFKLTKTVKISNNQHIIISGAYTLDSPDVGKHFEISAGATLTINNVILNGKDVKGGATWDYSGGVKVYGTFNMNSGKIQNGSGLSYNGSGIGVSIVEGVFNMYGGSIENNTSYSNGGTGVYAYEGTINMYGGTIAHNEATNETNGSGGGIEIFKATFNMYGGTIENNKASRGAGVYASYGSEVNLEKGTIKNNIASDNGGGLLISESVLNIKGSSQNVKIQNNKSWETTWKDNFTEGGGGLYITRNSTVKISNNSTIISGNTTGKYGGGIFIGYKSKLELNAGNTISGNTAMRGGGVYNGGSEVVMKGGTISDNKAIKQGNMTSSAYGGYGGGINAGIYGDNSLTDRATFTMTGGEIINNEAETQAGGIHIGASDFTMTNGTVKGNKAKNAGGIEITSMNLGSTRHRASAVINGLGILISENEATTGNGGGMILSQSDLTMTGATIKDNKAGYNGGGFYESNNQDVNYKLINTNIVENYAEKDGGGIYTPAHRRLIIENGYFKYNKAGNGGFAFDIMKDTVLKGIYDAQVTVKSLSDPFSLTDTDLSMRYAYNNHDVNYRSVVYPLSFDGNGSTGGQTPQGRRHFENNTVTVEFNPNNLTKTGHTFLGWSEDKDATTPTYDETNNTFVMPAEHVTLYAIWQLNTHTVIFQDEDGTELSKETVNYGDTAIEATKPTKAADAQYTYTFDKWVPSGTYAIDDLGNVTQDMVFVASYKKTVNQYTVIFQDDNGTELSTETVDYGTVAKLAEDPVKVADAQYTYTFDKWIPSGTYELDDLGNVVQDMIFVASYTKVVNQYTVIFQDEDGTELSTETVDYGAKALEAKKPTKAADDKYTYTFDKWVPSGTYVIDDLGNVKQDMIFVASYKATEIKQPGDPKPENPGGSDQGDDDEGDVLGATVEKDNGAGQGGNNVKTSDNTQVAVWTLGTMISLAVVVCASRKRKSIK